MKLTSTISSKGQVTVPLEIRRRLGLRNGDSVEFVPKGELTIVRPARSAPNPFTRYAGVLGAFTGVREINAWIDNLRGPRKLSSGIKVRTGSRANSH